MQTILTNIFGMNVAGHSSAAKDHPEYISEDGLHPTTLGYARLADLFYRRYKYLRMGKQGIYAATLWHSIEHVDHRSRRNHDHYYRWRDSPRPPQRIFFTIGVRNIPRRRLQIGAHCRCPHAFDTLLSSTTGNGRCY